MFFAAETRGRHPCSRTWGAEYSTAPSAVFALSGPITVAVARLLALTAFVALAARDVADLAL